MPEPIREKLRTIPDKPGVYFFRNGAGKIIYVGKGASLRSRVRSYFGSQRGFSPKTLSLVRASEDLEFLVTDSEVEALILEINMIKRYRPRYNIVF